jgi:hypothetical protein
MKVRLGLLAGAILLAIGVSVGATAFAATPPTHEQYVAGAEQICKSRSSQALALLKSAKKNIQADRAELGGRELIKASGMFESMGKRLKALPKPVEDTAALEEWTQGLDAENSVLRKAGVALVAGQKVKAQGYLTRFVHNAAAARDVVLGFGFNYCLFKKSA